MSLKRVNVMLDDDILHRLSEEGVNLSATIRELLEDRFSDHRVVLSVSKKTKTMYHDILEIVSGSDEEFEEYFVQALKSYLSDNRAEIESKINKYLK